MNVQQQPIRYPGRHDVLFGRGGQANNHSGNRLFRQYVADAELTYLRARKNQKVHIARHIVHQVHQNNGRFLERRNGYHDRWTVVSDQRAQEKASQRLREGLNVRQGEVRDPNDGSARSTIRNAATSPDGEIAHTIPALADELPIPSVPKFREHYERQISKSAVGPIVDV